MKKIAFVYDSIYPYIKGGAQKRYYEIGKRLAKDGYDVHLYGMKLWKGSDVIEYEGMKLHGICKPLNLYNSLYTERGKRSIWQAIYFGLHCLKLLKEDFDVMDCCGFPYFSLFSCKLVTLIKRKKLYSTWHEVWGLSYWKEYIGLAGYFGYLTEKISVHLPNEIIAVSKLTADRIKKELGYKGKITIVPNGIDNKFIETIKPSKHKSDIIYAGRLMDFKNIDILIKSIYLLRKKNAMIRCLIVGDGPEKVKLQKLSHELKLDKNIEFIEFLPRQEDLYSLMKSSKVFVLPSTREGFGITVIEANACGIPVITVKHKDNAATDLIDEFNGLVINSNEKIMATTIKKIIGKNYNQTNMFNFVVQFDWGGKSKELINIYNR